MGNRQDRRYAAKLARQSSKGGQPPAKQAIVQAAARYLSGEPAELDLSVPDLDDVWGDAIPLLWEQLGDEFDGFRREVFERASSLSVLAQTPDGEVQVDLYTILFPVVGEPQDLLSFAASPSRRAELSSSLTSSGVLPPKGHAEIMPVVLSQAALDFVSSGPAAVAELTSYMAEQFLAPPEDTRPSAEDLLAQIAAWALPLAADEEEGPVSGFLLGIAAIPSDVAQAPAEDDDEVADMVSVAAHDSWLDTYASTIPFRLGRLSIWSDAGAASAWQRMEAEIETERARHGYEADVSEVHVCYDDGNQVTLVAARCGEDWVGPFEIANALVFTDVDLFASDAERFGGKLVEYERPQKLRRLIESRKSKPD